jgi:hypothetical protein
MTPCFIASAAKPYNSLVRFERKYFFLLLYENTVACVLQRRWCSCTLVRRPAPGNWSKCLVKHFPSFCLVLSVTDRYLYVSLRNISLRCLFVSWLQQTYVILCVYIQIYVHMRSFDTGIALIISSWQISLRYLSLLFMALITISHCHFIYVYT